LIELNPWSILQSATFPGVFAPMISQSISILCRNWQYYLVVILLGLGALAFDEIKGKSSSGTATFFIWVMLALFVHMAVLFNKKFIELHFKVLLPFGLKVTALSILSCLIASPVLFATLGKSTGSSAGNTVSILLFTLSSLFAYALVLSLLGTWLPATVYGSGKTILDAAKRGLPAFFPTFGRLFLGLVVLPILSFAIIVCGSMALPSAMLIVNGMPNVPFILVGALSFLIQAFSVTYASVVLSRVYMAREGLPVIGNT
jgi:hypothetical protein